MRKNYTRVLLATYYLLYSFVFIGWLFHRSVTPALFQYSWRYLVFLIVMSSLFFLPTLIRIVYRSSLLRGRSYPIVPSMLVVIILYLAFSSLYYYTQRHLFDPFLQVPVPQFESGPGEKDENVFRILALGGSTTALGHLPAQARYPEVLRQILQEHYRSAKIEVFNAGQGWYTTKHSLINYVTYYRDWEPDLVVILHGLNDLYRSFSPPRYAIGEYDGSYTHFYAASINGAKPPTFEQNLLRRLGRPQLIFLDPWFSTLRFRQVDYPLERYVSLRSFEGNLAKLVKDVREDRLDVVLVTQPFLYKEAMSKNELAVLDLRKNLTVTRQNLLQEETASARSMYTAMRAFNEATTRVALSEGVALVDAADRMDQNLQYLVDDVHYTELGSSSLAEMVAESIIALDVIDRKPAPERTW